MNNDLANFSTDLLRISFWIYHKNDTLADKFLDLCKQNYSGTKVQVGCYQNIWDEIDKIKRFKENRMQSAERALTLSRIMLAEASVASQR